MKKYILFPCLALVLILTAFAPGSPDKIYTSSEGNFSATFPCDAKESSQVDTAANGKPITIHFVQCNPDDNHVYMVGWSDLSSNYAEETPIKKILENSRDGATNSMKAVNVKTVATVLGKTPYIEFTFESSEFMGKDRIYVVNKFQYSIITIFAKSKKAPPEVDKFISSFHFLS